jgi:hypothetical protein
MDTQTALDRAIVAAKTGRNVEARALLEAVLEVDERNEQAWLWMSGVVDSDEERIICLENVLTINPRNEAARQGLATLGATPTVSQTHAFNVAEELHRSPILPAEPPPPTAVSRGELPAGHPSKPDSRIFITITVALVLLLICTVVSILAFVVLSPVG